MRNTTVHEMIRPHKVCFPNNILVMTHMYGLLHTNINMYNAEFVEYNA